METVLIKNVLSNGPKDSSTPKSSQPSVDRHERNTLQVLQESAKGNVSVASGKERLEKKNENKAKVKILFDRCGAMTSGHSLKIYEDSSNSTTEDSHIVRCSRSVQTEDVLLDAYIQNKQLQNVNVSTDSGHLSGCFDQEAYDLMVNENIPETYWKDLAEVRRQALNDTLEENEKLSFEVEELKKENRRLSNIASKVEQLENLLQEALSDDAESDNKIETKPEIEAVNASPEKSDADQCCGAVEKVVGKDDEEDESK